MPPTSRRHFLKSAAAGASMLAAPAVAASAASANDRIRVAVVGLGGRGRVSHCGALQELAGENVEIAALCDCDENRAERGRRRRARSIPASGRPRLSTTASCWTTSRSTP